VRVETSHAKKVVEESSESLAKRLKRVQCVLDSFNCIHEESQALTERLFSKIELTA
jgi:hypothetical protein